MSRRLTFWPRRSRVSRVGGIAGAVVVAGVLVFTAAAAGAGSAGSAGPPPASRQDPTPPAPARPYQIPLPSRTLTPLGGLNVVAITGGATTGRIHYLLQLNELPNAPTREIGRAHV